MPIQIDEPITELIRLVRAGDQEARNRLWNAVFPFLKEKARAALAGNNVAGVMRPSDLLQDAMLQLMRYERIGWNDRKHLFAFAADVMRHIIIDRARKHLNKNRLTVELDESYGIEFNDDVSWVEVDEILDELARRDPVKAQIVRLRAFAGMTIEEIAEVLEISVSSVKRHLQVARAFIMSRMKPPEEKR